MMPSDRFERQLPVLLTELAEPRTPDYLDDLLGLTARTRQRPAWTFLERWLPMVDIARQPVLAPPLPWRSIGILLLLALTLAAGAVLIVGSLPRLPDPYGLARNGQILYAADGDIFLADSVSTEGAAIVSGPDSDFAPLFSLDGMSFAFLRETRPGQQVIMVTNADGSNLRQITGPLTNVGTVEWSPEGSSLLVDSSERGIPVISIAAADGSGFRQLNLGLPAESPSWRPTDGSQIVFRGQPQDGRRPGLFIVNADGSDLRQLALVGDELTGPYDFLAPVWSPDGSRVAYHRGNKLESGRNALRIHIAEIDPGGNVTSDRMLEFDPAADMEAWARWSPDGERVVFEQFKDGKNHVAVGPSDGSGPAVWTGPSSGVNDGMGSEWAPDGTSILSTFFGEQAMYELNPSGGEGHRLRISTDTASWQRLAR